jgi:multiple sugar transport system ATP-binding protein
MTGIRFEQVTKTYRLSGKEKVFAVQNLNFVVPRGEAFVLVGPSGSGKSTVLRMVAGLEKISKGDLYFNDLRVNDLPAKARDVTLVLQNYALYPDLTVAENLGFGLELRKVPKSEIKKRIQEVLPMLALGEELLKRLPATLSGGQKQRVAIGRAIIRRPQVLLCDEPMSNLDADTRLHLQTGLAQLQRQWGVTTLYVTHDLQEAKVMGHRIGFMKEGKLEKVVPSSEL